MERDERGGMAPAEDAGHEGDEDEGGPLGNPEVDEEALSHGQQERAEGGE